jgi:hypothetical protein
VHEPKSRKSAKGRQKSKRKLGGEGEDWEEESEQPAGLRSGNAVGPDIAPRGRAVEEEAERNDRVAGTPANPIAGALVPWNAGAMAVAQSAIAEFRTMGNIR